MPGNAGVTAREDQGSQMPSCRSKPTVTWAWLLCIPTWLGHLSMKGLYHHPQKPWLGCCRRTAQRD